MKRFVSLLLVFAILVGIAPSVQATDNSSDAISAIDATGWKTEKYSLGTITQESWFNAYYVLAEAYEVIRERFNHESTGSQAFYQSLLTELIADDSYLQVSGCFDALSVLSEKGSALITTLDIYNQISSEEIQKVASPAGSGNTAEIIDGFGHAVFVADSVWTLVLLGTGTAYTYSAVDLISQKAPNSRLKKAAVVIDDTIESLEEDPETAIASSLFSSKTIRYVLQYALDSKFEIFSTFVDTITDRLASINQTAENITAFQEWYGYGKLQEQILKVAKKLRAKDFDTYEEYVESYRSLAYTYILCCIKANAGFADLNGYDSDLYTSAQASLWSVLAAIASVVPQSDARVDSADLKLPSMLSVGDTFVSYGMIKGQELKEVEIVIRDVSTGSSACTAQAVDLGGIESYDIHDLDSQLKYNILPASTYSIEVSANEELVYSTPLVIRDEDGQFIVDQYRLPHPQPQGRTFAVRGFVKSREDLATVKVAIIKMDGTVLYGGDYLADGKRFELSTADLDLQFDKLKTGDYWYVVEAVDVTGNGEVLINQPFYIY